MRCNSLAAPCIRVIATAATAEIAYLRDLGADIVIDFRTQRFEDQVRDLDAVLDLREVKPRHAPFQVLRRGGKLISAVSAPTSACEEAWCRSVVLFGQCDDGDFDGDRRSDRPFSELENTSWRPQEVHCHHIIKAKQAAFAG